MGCLIFKCFGWVVDLLIEGYMNNLSDENLSKLYPKVVNTLYRCAESEKSLIKLVSLNLFNLIHFFEIEMKLTTLSIYYLEMWII